MLFEHTTVTASDENPFDLKEVLVVHLPEVITLFWIYVLVSASAYERCKQGEVIIYIITIF